MSPLLLPLSSVQSTEDVDAGKTLFERRGKVLAPIMPAPYKPKKKDVPPKPEWSPDSPSSMMPALPTPDSERLLICLIPNVPEPASVVAHANLAQSAVNGADLTNGAGPAHNHGAANSENPANDDGLTNGASLSNSDGSVNLDKSAVNGARANGAGPDDLADGDRSTDDNGNRAQPANGDGFTNKDHHANGAQPTNHDQSTVNGATHGYATQVGLGDYFAPRCAPGCFCRCCANVPKYTAVYPRPVPRRLLAGRTPPPVLMEAARGERDLREDRVDRRRQLLMSKSGEKEVVNGVQDVKEAKEEKGQNGNDQREPGGAQRVTSESVTDSADEPRNPTSAASVPPFVQHSASPDPLMLVVQVLSNPVSKPEANVELANGGLTLLLEDDADTHIDSDSDGAADAIVAPDAADDDADDSYASKVVSADNLRDTYNIVEAVSTPETANVVRTVNASDAFNTSQAAETDTLGTGNAADGVEAAYETEAADTAGVIDAPDAGNTKAADFLCSAQSYWHQFLQHLHNLHRCALLPAWRALRCLFAETQFMAILAILSGVVYVRPVIRKTFIVASCLQVFLWLVGTMFPDTHREICSALTWRLVPFAAGLFVVEKFVLGPVVVNWEWAWIDAQWERSRWQADYGADRAWDEECAERQEVMRWAQDVVGLVACDEYA